MAATKKRNLMAGIVRTLSFISLLVPVYAQAQTATAPRTPAETRAALRRVETSCVAEYAKSCPMPPSGVVSGRDQVICLKTIKPSLSMACRRAVVAASR